MQIGASGYGIDAWCQGCCHSTDLWVQLWCKWVHHGMDKKNDNRVEITVLTYEYSYDTNGCIVVWNGSMMPGLLSQYWLMNTAMMQMGRSLYRMDAWYQGCFHSTDLWLQLWCKWVHHGIEWMHDTRAVVTILTNEYSLDANGYIMVWNRSMILGLTSQYWLMSSAMMQMGASWYGI